MSSGSEFVDFIPPPKLRLQLYDFNNPPNDQPNNDAADPAKALPPGFIDAMSVRHEVFVEEQGVPLGNEIEAQDCKCFHWTAYASVPAKYNSPELAPTDVEANNKNNNQRRKSASTKIPIGTIRLVTPPHPPHPNNKKETAIHKSHETYVQLGRLAVIKEFRKAGISKLLIETALRFIREHPNDVDAHYDPVNTEYFKSNGLGVDFNGLVLVHAQIGVQKVWRKYGFETDESMGTWMEEGIEHVGMWKKVDVKEGKKNNRLWLSSGSP